MAGGMAGNNDPENETENETEGPKKSALIEKFRVFCDKYPDSKTPCGKAVLKLAEIDGVFPL